MLIVIGILPSANRQPVSNGSVHLDIKSQVTAEIILKYLAYRKYSK